MNMDKCTKLITLAAGVLLLVASAARADLPLNDDEVKCVNALNKRGSKVGKAQNKQNRACVKDAGKGKIPASDACLESDPKGKVGKARQKTTDDFAKKCGDVPDVGPNDANAVNDAFEDQARELARDVFGDLGTSVIDCDADKNGCKCQDAVVKNAGKIFDTKAKEFVKCKKDAGKAGIAAAADIANCVTPGGIAADAKGKIAKKVGKLGDDIAKKCSTVPATNAFPAQCAGLGGNALRDCIDALIECRVCLAINAADNLSVNCGTFSGITCPPGAPPTNTPAPSATPTATSTPGLSCPLSPGNYTLTQVSGGSLIVDGLPAFPFPSGGTINQTVGAGDANCVHPVAVPFPGGFNAPVFCIPSLGFTTSVVQTGCGIGRIDSNGGSDFTISEIGDTSAPNPPCSLPASCSNGGNSNVRVDVTVGNGAADVCGSGTANATVSVPVFTTTWLTFAGCPDPDGMYNPGPDTLIVSFPQTLDFTTDSTLGDWADLDPDGCCIAGAGPASFTNPCNPGGPGGLSSTGTCIDLTGLDVAGADVTTVAAGAVGSSGSPLYDLTFVTTLPNELTTAGGGAATCATPPTITYGGTATRCIP
jgi:hypothetical protein